MKNAGKEPGRIGKEKDPGAGGPPPRFTVPGDGNIFGLARLRTGYR